MSSVVCLVFVGDAVTVAARVVRGAATLLDARTRTFLAGACEGDNSGRGFTRSKVSITSGGGLVVRSKAVSGLEGRVWARWIGPRLLFVTLIGSSGNNDCDLPGEAWDVKMSVGSGVGERKLTTASYLVVVSDAFTAVDFALARDGLTPGFVTFAKF